MRVFILLVSMMVTTSAYAEGGLMDGDCAGANKIAGVFYDIASSINNEAMYNELGDLLIKEVFSTVSTDDPGYAEVRGIVTGIKAVVWKYHTKLSRKSLGDIAEEACVDTTGWVKA